MNVVAMKRQQQLSIFRLCLPMQFFYAHHVHYSHNSQILTTNLKLKSLCQTNRIENARVLFDQMPTKDEYSWNTLITAYVRSGRLSESLHLFNNSPHRDSTTISWSFIMSAHIRYGRGDEALQLFLRMRREGPKPDMYTLGASLRACAVCCYSETGRQVHALAFKTLFGDDGFVIAGLIDFYSKCRCINEAVTLFSDIPDSEHRKRNHVLWAAMIIGHAQNGNAIGALTLFKTMKANDVLPNQFILPTVLTAFSSVEHLTMVRGFGAQVHAYIVRSGYYKNNFVQCALVDMYAKSGDPITGGKVLQITDTEDVVGWNSLLIGYVKSGREHEEEAWSLFTKMHCKGLELDEYTYSTVLSHVGSIGHVEKGRVIHGLVTKAGYDKNYRHVSNAMVDMYAKVGRLDSAFQASDEIRHMDVVGWTSLIAGCARHLSHEKALKIFREMMRSQIGIENDEFLAATVLSSCAAIAVLYLGRQIHAIIIHIGVLSFVTVANSAVTMYAKCGCVDDSRRIFDSMENNKDAITWTALIVGYAQNGRGNESVEIYRTMLQTGHRPDYITFIGLLFACSHAGLVEEGKVYFSTMESVHNIKPGAEHCGSMIDLLGRAGRIQEAVHMIESGVTPPDATVWKSLLAACRVHREVEIAEKAAENLFELEPNDAVPYVLMSNIYSTAGKWSEVGRVRKLMRSRGISKELGCSWMEMGKEVHVFRAEDRIHPRTAEVYSKVEEMMERITEAGYVVDNDWATHEKGREGRERSLKYHSEKLAVGFGLISVSKEEAIRVFKNLRVCGDCHNAMKFVTKVYERRIVLRDSNCFHHFNDGVCSCRDYW